MSSTNTTRLGLLKPTPGSNEPFDLVRFNSDLDKIDRGGNGPYVCTSGSRPNAPYLGMQIFETDTGNVLYWYDPPGIAAIGWYKPWNLAWGRVVPKVSVSGNIGGASLFNTNATSAIFSFQAGRKYRLLTQFAVYAPDTSPGGFLTKLALGGNVDTDIDEHNTRLFTGCDFYNVAFEHSYEPASNVSATIKVKTSQGASVVVFGVDTDKNNLLTVDDMGGI
jgi:hypothetical protein